MKQIQSFISHYFALNSRRKAVMVSLMLHLGILLLFTSPMMKNIPHPQIIFVSFPNEAGLSALSPSTDESVSAAFQKNVVRINHSVSAGQKADTDHNRTLSFAESKPVLMEENDISENKPSARENLSATDSDVSAGSDGALSGASNSGVAEGNGSEGNEPIRVAESRFGDRGAPAFIYQEIPVYPSLARRLGKEGRVLLKLLIDANGKLVNVEVVEAAGYGFTEASVAAVKNSTYAPGYRDGVKVATRALLPVRFHLQ